jgi:hypothetical protein
LVAGVGQQVVQRGYELGERSTESATFRTPWSVKRASITRLGIVSPSSAGTAHTYNNYRAPPLA